MSDTFLDCKLDYDRQYAGKDSFTAFIPVNLENGKECIIKSNNGSPNEEYYKWQFLYSLVYSGLYPKDYIGAEIGFPKGNKKANPIEIDAAIFDDKSWFERYYKMKTEHDQDSLDWLRKHMVVAIEFKRNEKKNIDQAYNEQLKPAMKESERDYCLGVIYDNERLFLFHKREGKYLRLNEFYNEKGPESGISDLSLHLPDAYRSIPSFNDLHFLSSGVSLSPTSQKTLDELEQISGIHSKQINSAMHNILSTIDSVSLSNSGYELLIKILALKIYDEKCSKRNPNRTLEFYVSENELDYKSLNDQYIQSFIRRFKKLLQSASQQYYEILNGGIDFKNESVVRVMITAVRELQDYSFVNSFHTDLYQLVFYRFADSFAKSKNSQFVTPIPVIDFLVQIVNPRGEETVMDPTVGIGDFLSISYVNSESKLDDKNLYGVDNDRQMIMLAKLNMLLNGDGNARLLCKPDLGSITSKFDTTGNLVELIPELNSNGRWDNRGDSTKLMKFDVVLTNPPFGEDRKWHPKTQKQVSQSELYELWKSSRAGSWIDPGLLFLENAFRVLKVKGRMGIILSNSIASIDRWKKARAWLISKMRIVALFDLPPNVFADTGVNTTILVAYKPDPEDLKRLIDSDYEIFVKDIKRIGYEVRTSKRVKFFKPKYEVDPDTFQVSQQADGTPKIDEEFTETVGEFRKWCLSQEETLQDLFIRKR